MKDIPAHSHLEIMGFAESTGNVNTETWVLNPGDELHGYGGASYKVGRGDERDCAVRRLRRAFPDDLENKTVSMTQIQSYVEDDSLVAHAVLHLSLEDAPDTFVADAILPFKNTFAVLARPEAQVFLRHASEEKSVPRTIADVPGIE